MGKQAKGKDKGVTTRSKCQGASVKKKVAVMALKKKASNGNNEVENPHTSAEEMPYERLYNKLQAKKRQAEKEIADLCKAKGKKTKVADEEVEFNETQASFVEGNNYIDMNITEEQDREFPAPSEDEENSEDEDEGLDLSSNNNATRPIESWGNKYIGVVKFKYDVE